MKMGSIQGMRKLMKKSTLFFGCINAMLVALDKSIL